MDQQQLGELTDHDILLLLSQTVKTNHEFITGQMKTLNDNVNDIKSGIYKQLGDHEARIRVIEDLHTKIDPLKTKEKVLENEKRVDLIYDAYKILIGVIFFLNILYAFIFSNIVNIHKLIFGGK